MELNAEMIKKALECCTNNGECKECPINPHKGNYGYCTSLAINHALALINSQEQRIKELTEENERLSAELEQRPSKLIITKLPKKENENV